MLQALVAHRGGVQVEDLQTGQAGQVCQAGVRDAGSIEIQGAQRFQTGQQLQLRIAEMAAVHVDALLHKTVVVIGCSWARASEYQPPVSNRTEMTSKRKTEFFCRILFSFRSKAEIRSGD